MNLEAQRDFVDGRSRRAQKKRERRRADLLRSAEKVFAKNGYHASSIADIIEQAGVSRGTFYLYFESRAAVFQELVDHFVSQLINSIEQVHIEDGKPIEDLLSNVRRVVNLLFENRERTAILLREAVGHHSEVDQKLEKLDRFLVRMVSGALRNGAKWGLTRKVDEAIISLAVIGAIKQVLYQYLVIDTKEPPDKEKLASELLAFGLQGLAKTE